MRKITIIIISLFVVSTSAIADGLKSYIDAGLQSNLVVKKKEYSYQKSLYALKEARSLFMPKISFHAKYSRAKGGRVIGLPLGDMLNPVYKSLNQLTGSSMPMLQNQNINLLREKEQETKISVRQPLFNSKLYYNQKIKKEQVAITAKQLVLYKRQLVSDIKCAYFNYLKAYELNELLSTTKLLLIENLRVNKSLYDNGKVTIDKVYRSEAEVSKLDKQIANADKNINVSKSYFNFLINRDLTSDIERYSISSDYNRYDSLKIDEFRERNEQLMLLKSQLNISKHMINNSKASYLPTVAAGFDVGYNAEDYSLGANDDFMVATVSLSWNIFSGFSSSHKIKMAKIQRQELEATYQASSKQIEHFIISSYYDLEEAAKQIDASKKELTSTKQAFEIVQKSYNQGQATFISFLDSRTTMTKAATGLIIAKYDFEIKSAIHEKTTSSYCFNHQELSYTSLGIDGEEYYKIH